LDTSEEVKEEMKGLIKEQARLIKLAADIEDTIQFGTEYQAWYSRAIKVVEALAPERLKEFNEYYLIDPKRKTIDAGNYVIQDYIKAMGARVNQYNEPLWDINNLTQIRVTNQIQIILSLEGRINSVLQDVTGHLFAELQDKELEAATQLIKASPRAAGALAGVVLERHLQRAANNHEIKLTKKASTIADLNDPLKKKGVYGTPTWRKIQLLADIRNLCSHQKEEEPTKEQVNELIDGVNTIIKTVF
jgi:DNA-binding FrmR family transcriptional regulator